VKAADLREKTREDLLELRKLLARDVFRNRLKNFTNRLDDTSAVRKTRRDLARVLTLLRQRQEAAASASEEPAAETSVPVAEPPKRESRGAAAAAGPAAEVGAARKTKAAARAEKKVARADRPDSAADRPAPSAEGARRKKPAGKKGEAKE
jgi:large subunit ribosomal protein L29